MGEGDAIDMVPLPAKPIAVFIIDQNGKKTEYKIQTNRIMGTVFEEYMQRAKGKSCRNTDFFHEGSRVSYYDTPAPLKLLDVESVDFVRDQCGC